MPKIIYNDSSGIERAIELGAEPVLIGRAPECQVQTQDGLVSRRHARIAVYDGLYWIEDLQSANGVYVNGQRTQQSQLRPGDEVVCGSLAIRFVADVAAAIRRTQGMAAYVEPPASSASQPPVLSPNLAVEITALREELEGERRRRTDAEFDRDEARRRAQQLEAQLAAAPQPSDAEELARLRRRNEQLESELRRGRGGTASAGPGAEAFRALEAERDRLRARVTELEAQPPKTVPPADDMELIRLQRRIDQLQSELRRVRSGGAPAEAAPSASADAEERVRRLEQEREAALRQLRDVERERDSLRALVATGQVPPKARPPARATELVQNLGDALADIRGALRAAGDEAALEQLEQVRGQLRELGELLGS